MTAGDTIRLRCSESEAGIALLGAEPVRWRVGGRDLLWNRDPEHWAYSAPILFPVVGASAGGIVRVDRIAYPMAQHGFARTSRFAVVERTEASARLRLEDDAETRRHYPFAFRLDMTATLDATSLDLAFEVSNTGADEMPYALGVHPAFPWPLAGRDRAGHAVIFDEAEVARVPEVAPGGLLARTTRAVPLAGTTLPLRPDLFSEALVFLDARSRAFRFRAPGGAAIAMAVQDFPHLAVWSRPAAPFLSLEAWTGHADWEDAAGEFRDRAAMIRLPAGGTARHRATMAYTPGA